MSIDTKLAEETAEEFRELLPMIKRLREKIVAEFPGLEHLYISAYAFTSSTDLNCNIDNESIVAQSAPEFIEKIRAHDPEKARLKKIAALESQIAELKAVAKS